MLLGTLAETLLLEALASPYDAFIMWSMSSLYTAAESAEIFAAFILFVELSVLRHGANFLYMQSFLAQVSM